MSRSPFSSAAAALAAVAAVQHAAATIASLPRAVKGDGFLSIPIGRMDRPLSLGTPAQSISVLLDTGSSDLWVSPTCTPMPGLSSVSTCDAFGSYVPSRSRSVQGPVGQEVIEYGDPTEPSTQTSVTLSYFADDLTIAGATIKNQIFGVMTEGEQPGIAGIFGLAPDLRGFDKGKPYSLVLNSMVEEGIIKSRAFSLDLRHAESETGAVIYGGLDVKKFAGKLAKFPLQPGLSGEARLAVSLSTVGTTRSRRTVHPVPPASAVAVLDSGTTLTRLSPSLARPILQELGASVDTEGFFVAPCSIRRTSATVDFGFGTPGEDPGVTLRVRASDFVLDLPHLSDQNLCYVGLRVTDHQQILGDSVLRGGYFVFDWDNEEVHVAPAANCGSEVVAIGTGSGAVPNVEGKCSLDDNGPQITDSPTATINDGSLPTDAFTTTYTITECPAFDRQCTVGAVTTKTFIPLKTGDATDSNDDDDGAASGRGGLLDIWLALATTVGGVYMLLR
ncbi:related to aspartic-type signal peptidase [Cephalotrichum gorgonifer]|uniref:Related to aspartic-type signal peptidase n=1 Tax=Cephalotrichum gorgonifer TaxID=2041049 RepID=A0AAE8MVT0_9PEZI|nr:related to aspartic-type signal peptidase [Cephalotrichum gorgonifer]